MTIMSAPQQIEQEFNWYLEHQAELVEQYNGKVLVIKGRSVIGVYDTAIEAFEETNKTEAPGTFIIQRCTPGDEAYTSKYHSRVAFI